MSSYVYRSAWYDNISYAPEMEMSGIDNTRYNDLDPEDEDNYEFE